MLSFSYLFNYPEVFGDLWLHHLSSISSTDFFSILHCSDHSLQVLTFSCHIIPRPLKLFSGFHSLYCQSFSFCEQLLYFLTKWLKRISFFNHINFRRLLSVPVSIHLFIHWWVHNTLNNCLRHFYHNISLNHYKCLELWTYTLFAFFEYPAFTSMPEFVLPNQYEWWWYVVEYMYIWHFCTRLLCTCTVTLFVCAFVRNYLWRSNQSLWLSSCGTDWISYLVLWFCIQLSGTKCHCTFFHLWHCGWSVLFCILCYYAVAYMTQC